MAIPLPIDVVIKEGLQAKFDALWRLYDFFLRVDPKNHINLQNDHKI
jgi:hypothetical protein